jgi:cell division septal protein FtsQ
MSRKKQPVARRKKSAAARVRPFWILLVLVGAIVALGGYYAATWPGFRAHHIVVIGNRRVPTKLIVARADIHPRINIWLQNMGAAADRIARIPDVGAVTVGRGFPASVNIVVHERIPFAVIRSAGRSAVVDSQLRVLTVRTPNPLPQFNVNVALPPAGGYIKDERALRIRDDYEKLTDANVVVVSLSYDKFGDLIAQTPRGVRILLGDDEDLQRKVALIGPILSQTAKKKIAAIDLRAPNTPVVSYK